MILANTVASAANPGGTVQAPADETPLLGLSAVGNGRNWVSTPGSFNAALATITAASGSNVANNIDWTAAGFFTITQYAGAYTLTFATTATAALTAANQVGSFSLGQTIAIWIPAVGSAAITWPSTITWVTSAAATAPTTTTNGTLVYLTCTAVGSAPTFIGFYLTN